MALMQACSAEQIFQATTLPPTVTMVLFTAVTGVRPDTVTVALHW